MSSVEKRTILLDALVNVEKSGSGKKLHDHGGGDDGRDTQLHQRSTIGREDDSHPIERISPAGSMHTVDRDLTADKVDEQNDTSPDHLFSKKRLK